MEMIALACWENLQDKIKRKHGFNMWDLDFHMQRVQYVIYMKKVKPLMIRNEGLRIY